MGIILLMPYIPNPVTESCREAFKSWYWEPNQVGGYCPQIPGIIDEVLKTFDALQINPAHEPHRRYALDKLVATLLVGLAELPTRTLAGQIGYRRCRDLVNLLALESPPQLNVEPKLLQRLQQKCKTLAKDHIQQALTKRQKATASAAANLKA